MEETDLYSDSEDSSAPAEEAKPETKTEDAESAGEQTALLPKAIFLGKDLKVGNKCEFEIKEIHEDEVSVKYKSHSKSKSEPEDDLEQVPESDSELAGLME